ncbi:molybdenum cofactor biosynthesis protein MoaE [Acinetobacter sp. ANC 5502]
MDFARIQNQDLSLDCFAPIADFPACGGIGSFIGVVRNHHAGRAVDALYYSAYAPLAEKMIRQIEQEVQAKYAVQYVRVVHRVGKLGIGGTAIIALAYAEHRREAFAACEEAVERVKHEVPVWKEEFYSDGTSQFVTGCCIRKDYSAEEHGHSDHTYTHSHAHSQH